MTEPLDGGMQTKSIIADALEQYVEWSCDEYASQEAHDAKRREAAMVAAEAVVSALYGNGYRVVSQYGERRGCWKKEFLTGC